MSILTRPLDGRAGLPLLRPVRPRLRDPLQLLDPVRAPAPGAGHRAAADRDRRHGARGHDRRRGPRDRRRVHGQRDRRGRHVRARVVVVAASACESARLLLNSRSRAPPERPRQLERRRGRYLMDSVGAMSAARPGPRRPAAPQRRRRRRHARLHAVVAATTGSSTSRAATTSSSAAAAHARHGFGGGIEQVQGRRIWKGPEGRLPGLLRRLVGFAGRGEMIPNARELLRDRPEVVDRWGIPVLRFHCEVVRGRVRRSGTWRDLHRDHRGHGGQCRGARERAAEGGISTGGEIIHEVGTTRMGTTRGRRS